MPTATTGMLLLFGAQQIASGAALPGAGPFGLALTPPMGFRSWNSMGARVTQAKMQTAFQKLAEKRAGGVSLAGISLLAFPRAALHELARG